MENNNNNNNRRGRTFSSYSISPKSTIQSLNQTDSKNNELTEREKRRIQLKEIFDDFDIDGGGTIELDEMKYALKKILNEMGTNKNENIDESETFKNLEAQFQLMDKDGSGEVSFEEFATVILDASNRTYNSLEDETKCSQFGLDLFVLLASFRRYNILKSLNQLGNRASCWDQLVHMKKLLENSTFAINMYSQELEYNKKREILMKKAMKRIPKYNLNEIERRTTFNFSAKNINNNNTNDQNIDNNEENNNKIEDNNNNNNLILNIEDINKFHNTNNDNDNDTNSLKTIRNTTKYGYNKKKKEKKMKNELNIFYDPIMSPKSPPLLGKPRRGSPYRGSPFKRNRKLKVAYDSDGYRYASNSLSLGYNIDRKTPYYREKSSNEKWRFTNQVNYNNINFYKEKENDQINNNNNDKEYYNDTNNEEEEYNVDNNNENNDNKEYYNDIDNEEEYNDDNDNNEYYNDTDNEEEYYNENYENNNEYEYYNNNNIYEKDNYSHGNNSFESKSISNDNNSLETNIISNDNNSLETNSNIYEYIDNNNIYDYINNEEEYNYDDDELESLFSEINEKKKNKSGKFEKLSFEFSSTLSPDLQILFAPASPSERFISPESFIVSPKKSKTAKFEPIENNIQPESPNRSAPFHIVVQNFNNLNKSGNILSSIPHNNSVSYPIVTPPSYNDNNIKNNYDIFFPNINNIENDDNNERNISRFSFSSDEDNDIKFFDNNHEINNNNYDNNNNNKIDYIYNKKKKNEKPNFISPIKNPSYFVFKEYKFPRNSRFKLDDIDKNKKKKKKKIQ